MESTIPAPTVLPPSRMAKRIPFYKLVLCNPFNKKLLKNFNFFE